MKELIPLLIIAVFIFGPQLIAGYFRVRQNAQKQRELEAMQAEEEEFGTSTGASMYPQTSPRYGTPFDPFASVANAQAKTALPPVVVKEEPLVIKEMPEEQSKYSEDDAPQGNKHVYIDNLRELISTPEGVMSAFIASEVFRRPEEHW